MLNSSGVVVLQRRPPSIISPGTTAPSSVVTVTEVSTPRCAVTTSGSLGGTCCARSGTDVVTVASETSGSGSEHDVKAQASTVAMMSGHLLTPCMPTPRTSTLRLPVLTLSVQNRHFSTRSC